MKGAALTVNPRLRFVDITHEVEPHHVLQGALILRSVFDHFPPGTILVAVVDPGVGSERRILAAEAAGRLLLAPDNGLLTPLLDERGPARVHSVTESRYFRPQVQPTFHGRDIFAPVAAHLATGVTIEQLGPPVTDSVRLEIPRPERLDRELTGEVIYVDRFGNLVTNLTEKDLPSFGGERALIEVGGREVRGLSPSYVAGGEPLKVVVGSWGFLEVALREGSASHLLGVGVGGNVRVRAPEAGA